MTLGLDDRAGLQVLLRAASEALVLLPADSEYVSSVEALEHELTRILSDDEKVAA